MVKEKKINVAGKDITLKALSFGAKLRLQRLEKRDLYDLYREMLSEEDFVFLDQIDSREDEQKVRDAFNELFSDADPLGKETEKKNTSGT